jgi:SAM-dependent methyltransferase
MFLFVFVLSYFYRSSSYKWRSICSTNSYIRLFASQIKNHQERVSISDAIQLIGGYIEENNLTFLRFKENKRLNRENRTPKDVCTLKEVTVVPYQKEGMFQTIFTYVRAEETKLFTSSNLSKFIADFISSYAFYRVLLRVSRPSDENGMQYDILLKRFDNFTLSHAIVKQTSTFPKLERKKDSKENPLHNRLKEYLIPKDAPFLKQIGITQFNPKLQSSEVLHSMQDKYKQINQFVIIFQQILDSLNKNRRPIEVLDLGCGKAYLTFALHYYLSTLQNSSSFSSVRTYGVDFQPSMIANNQQITEQLGYPFQNQLNFYSRSIEDLMKSMNEGNQMAHLSISNVLGFITSSDISISNDLKRSITPMQVLVALHACDTATDDAIYLGIRLSVDVIILAPCCHKQLRPQLNRYSKKIVQTNARELETTATSSVQPNPLPSILMHNIYRERYSEMLTDSLRADILEAAGYDTKIIEFIDGIHTPKNIMIIGVRNQFRRRQETVSSISLNKQLSDKIEGNLKVYGIDDFKLWKLIHEQSDKNVDDDAFINFIKKI